VNDGEPHQKRPTLRQRKGNYETGPGPSPTWSAAPGSTTKDFAGYMLAVVTYLLVSAIEWVAESPHAAPPTVGSEPGVERFDPCMMWEQVPATVRISTLVWFTSFLILLVQGFRNRAVPRWLAIACLIAVVPTFHHQLWRVQQCYTKLGAVDFWICIGTVCLMCLHQAFQRRLRVVVQPKG
jgi:hypothetical protein